MSIQSQINRIAGNVTAALTAIGNKGVTVPSGSDSDDLATLIAAIPSVHAAEATTTLTSNSQYISFTVAGEPVCFACIPTLASGTTVSLSSGGRIVTGVYKYDSNFYHGMMTYQSTTFSIRTNHAEATYSNGTLQLHITASNGGNFWKNVTYRLLYVY